MRRIPEQVLHRIWESRSTSLPHFRTTDGRPVTVLHPGTANPDSGPDFLRAVLRIGGTTFHGDVEIHTAPAEWHAHRHDTDPRYNRVILHVVRTYRRTSAPACTAAGRQLPLLVLDRACVRLPSPRITPQERHLARVVRRLQRASDPQHTLRRYGWCRIRRKTDRFQERLVQLAAEARGERYPAAHPASHTPVVRTRGTARLYHPRGPSQRELTDPSLWEQLLYEGMMEAMGYGRNAAAFLALARHVTLASLRRCPLTNPDATAALLFSTAGLLPDQPSAAGDAARQYITALHDRLHALRPTILLPPLEETGWLFFRLRPANFPTARIAAMTALLPVLFAPGRVCALVKDAVSGPGDERARLRRLREALTVRAEGYWAHHLHFTDRRKERGVCLGRDRITVMMLNVLLPTALLYARMTGDTGMERPLRRLAAALPRPYEPRIVREVRERARPGTNSTGAVEQLGILELLNGGSLRDASPDALRR